MSNLNPDKPRIRKIRGGMYFCQSKSNPNTGYGTSMRNAFTSWLGMVHKVDV